MGGGAVRLEAVLETRGTADPGLWPVAARPAGAWFLALNGAMSPAETGNALAVLVDHHLAEDEDVPPDAGAALRRLVAVDALLLPGGLRLTSGDGSNSLEPGCCCGLEDWREWLDLVDGGTPWLGHDPAPQVEHLPGRVRFWPQGHGATPHPLTLRTGELPVLLEGVRRELTGFLDCVAQWADGLSAVDAALGAALVERLDEALCATEPLHGPVLDDAG